MFLQCVVVVVVVVVAVIIVIVVVVAVVVVVVLRNIIVTIIIIVIITVTISSRCHDRHRHPHYRRWFNHLAQSFCQSRWVVRLLHTTWYPAVASFFATAIVAN